MPNKKLERFIRKKGLYVAMAFIVGGLIGIPILFWFASVIIIGIGTIFILFFCSGMLCLLQWKYVKNHIDMAYNHFAMFAFFGFGTCLVNFILLLNYTIRVHSYSETYSIMREGYYNEIVIAGDAQYIELERNLSTYLSDHPDEAVSLSNKITITFDTGLFGFDMISDCKSN